MRGRSHSEEEPQLGGATVRRSHRESIGHSEEEQPQSGVAILRSGLSEEEPG